MKSERKEFCSAGKSAKDDRSFVWGRRRSFTASIRRQPRRRRPTERKGVYSRHPPRLFVPFTRRRPPDGGSRSSERSSGRPPARLVDPRVSSAPVYAPRKRSGQHKSLHFATGRKAGERGRVYPLEHVHEDRHQLLGELVHVVGPIAEVLHDRVDEVEPHQLLVHGRLQVA